jgi:putative DNA primase/helicase
MLDEALRYLAAGLKPIPVAKGAKRPSLPAWTDYQRRAPTAAELEAWFQEGYQGNVGTVIPPGWLVIDFDGGKDAEALLNAAGVQLPEDAPRVRSGSGGYHAYLRLPPGVRDFGKVPGRSFLHATDGEGNPCKPFVEVLTVNNFAVLPPSVHPNGKPYEWVVELEGAPPEAPAALLALVAQKTGNPVGGAKAAKPAKSKAGNAPGWVEELSKGTGPGTHDDSMTKLAGYYVRKGLAVQQVIDIIDSGYGRRSWQVPGVPHRIPMADIKRVVESVARKEARKGEDQAGGDEFQLLGYDHELYYYLSRATGQVVELTARNHDKHNLLRLASLRYWESRYGAEHGVHWSGAQAALIDAQHRVGVFDQDRFRGRGAWWDPGHGAVMHTGTHLVTEAGATLVKDLAPGRYVYEMSKPLDVALAEPLPASASRQVLELFEALQWEHPHHARLAAGWCVVATVCGAVEWRPHIWVSGPSGTGKSWTVDNLIKRLLGNLALSAQSNTTEAGLRQALGHDARPVVFDEAEAEGQRDDARMANVLGLIRQASSETGGAILKGSSDGTSRSYRIRSCFAMSSINVSAYQAADRNRISILEMAVDQDQPQAERDAAFKALRARVATLLTDEFVAGFRARCVRLIPVIRKNAEVFAVAASGKIGSRRLGDQVGTLLAGCYALLADEPVDPATADELLDDQDLSQQKALRQESDESDLLAHILQAVVRVPTSQGALERDVATLAKVAAGEGQDLVGGREAAEALALIGLRAGPDGLVVANTHRGVKRLVEGTHWAKDWGRTLKRLPGARLSGVTRIGTLTCRGVVVPWECVK